MFRSNEYTPPKRLPQREAIAQGRASSYLRYPSFLFKGVLGFLFVLTEYFPRRNFHAGLNLLILNPQKVGFDRAVGPVSRQQGAVLTLVSQLGPLGLRRKCQHCLQRQEGRGMGSEQSNKLTISDASS